MDRGAADRATERHGAERLRSCPDTDADWRESGKGSDIHAGHLALRRHKGGRKPSEREHSGANGAAQRTWEVACSWFRGGDGDGASAQPAWRPRATQQG